MHLSVARIAGYDDSPDNMCMVYSVYKQDLESVIVDPTMRSHTLGLRKRHPQPRTTALYTKRRTLHVAQVEPGQIPTTQQRPVQTLYGTLRVPLIR